MKLTNYFFICIFSLSVFMNAQEIKPNQTLDSGTIENQFDYVIKKSYSYKEYKNIKLDWLNRLKKAVNDSLNINRKELADLKVALDSKNTEINTLTTSLETSKKNVAQLNLEKTSINFFGTLVSKPLYNTILWSIIGALLALLIVFIIRFSRSNSITKTTNDKFDELESEYENHKHNSLEREQQLRRKLQDKINKQQRKGK
ncbi:MAG: tRNA (guanine-N1)-methyltransferase [Flavobacteriaceae bacterium]|nr:tRNA (guanine-N1)-methyltransferase [Flavobacteriaceae bacterium]